MGNKQIKHESCNCHIYTQYGHCCNIECINESPKHHRLYQQLKDCLEEYNSGYLIDEIVQFLPNLNNKIVQYGLSRNEGRYFTYINSTIIHRLDTNQALPCKTWMKYIKKNIKNRHGGLNITVIGPPNTGKRRLIERFVFGTYTPTYTSWMYLTSSGYRKSLSFSGGNIDLNVTPFDMDKYYICHDHRDDFYILCFNINRPNQWDKIIDYRQQLYLSNKSGFGMILVATGCDVIWDGHHYDQSDEYIQITSKAIQCAQRWNIPYIETSAKYNINIQFLFQQSVYEYWIQQQMQTNAIYIH